MCVCVCVCVNNTHNVVVSDLSWKWGFVCESKKRSHEFFTESTLHFLEVFFLFYPTIINLTFALLLLSITPPATPRLLIVPLNEASRHQ